MRRAAAYLLIAPPDSPILYLDAYLSADSMPSPSILLLFLTSWAIAFVDAHKPGQAHGGTHRPAKLVRMVNKSAEDIAPRNNDGVNKYWKTVWYEGKAFIDEFDFENIDDPTHGRV